MVDFFFGNFYDYFLWAMFLLAVVIFIVLQFITPAYGMTFNNRWGVSINSKWGWVVMEAPVFILMTLLYLYALCTGICTFNWVTFICFVLFQLHYFQRSYIFPALMRGSSKMPLSIISLGFFFNATNAYMQGGWLFYVSSHDAYPIEWLYSPQFIIGVILFFAGMVINMHADRIIRKLRTNKQDNNYYLPKGFLFDTINSANFFGELLEWFAFALLTWSLSGAIFFLWSFANLVPRAKAVYERYTQFFGDDFTKLHRYKIFPYIY